jgi:hypothetical protein
MTQTPCFKQHSVMEDLRVIVAPRLPELTVEHGRADRITRLG